MSMRERVKKRDGKSWPSVQSFTP